MIGSHFIASVTDKEAAVTELLLKQIINVMARIIAGKAQKGKDARHELREREERGTPQLIRVSDNAKAWRITLTSDGAGWRMHYWHIPGGTSGDTIEFSNILTKKDLVRIY